MTTQIQIYGPQEQVTLIKEMNCDIEKGLNLRLKDVYTALYDATDQWFDIGLQLDVDSNDLKRIYNESTLQNNTERLREMLTVRLAQGDLTWDQITEALENRTIGQKVLAYEIRSKYIEPESAEPESATTIPPVERAFAANSMPTMATTTTVTPVTSTSNTATKTLTTTITAATSNQPLSSFKEPSTSTILINALPRGTLNIGLPSTIVPKTNTTSTREGNQSGAPMVKERPGSNTLPGNSERPKTSEAEFYNEDMFVIKSSLKKYQCIHCKKIPKRFVRCKCAKVDEKQETGKGKPRFDGNTGLSCSDCTHQACTSCGQSNQYEPDKFTSDNIRKLKVSCENNCGETITLNNLENRSHVRNKCSKRKRLCKYAWAGCKIEGAGEEIEKHEKKVGVHVLAAIDKLHKENLELRKDNSDLKKENLDLNKHIKMIEAKLNPGSSGPLTTRQL